MTAEESTKAHLGNAGSASKEWKLGNRLPQPHRYSGNDERASEQLKCCGAKTPVNDGSDAKSVYYTIALLGKSGQGKSTTGNKLLAISNDAVIKDWRCCDQSLLRWFSDTDPKCFEAAGTAKSVTTQCQMLSNENTRIRVLDIPGFADSQANNKSTIQRNAGLIDTVMKIQKELDIRFQRILYFLPIRGVFERSDAYCQDELKALYYYFGDSVFRCMVIIATKSEYESTEFSSKGYERTKATIAYTMTEVTQNKKPSCPPVVYIPFSATPEELLVLVQTAPVINNVSLDPTDIFQSYSDDEEWDKWIEYFELLSTQRSLDSWAKLQMLKTLLTGETKAAFEKISESDNVTYDGAKHELRKHIYTIRYVNRKKNNSEEWKDFAANLCVLAKIAFPNMQQDSINDMVIADIRVQATQHVINLALPDKLSIDSIVMIVTATEAIQVAYTAEDKGKGWENWIMNFEGVVTLRSLDECTRVQWLKARLGGKALEIFNGIPERLCTGYMQTKYIFCTELFTYLFTTRKKIQAERWDNYANELIVLAEKGYPKLPKHERETKILDHILQQVKNPLHKTRKWNTLNEAVVVIAAGHEIPNVYADETGSSWQTWLTDFETKCGIHVHNENKLLWLKVSISTTLMPLFETVLNENQNDYVMVTKAFQELLEARNRFHSRNKLLTEEWKELCDNLCLLAKRFVPEKQRNRIVLTRLLSVIEQNGIKLPKMPETLEEALALTNITKKLEILSIPKYSGEGSWEKWLISFESVLLSQGSALTENAKLMFLEGHLKAQPLELYCKLPSELRSTYEIVKQEFQIELYKWKFDSITRKSCNNWKEFAKELNIIAEKAFPTINEGERKSKVLKHFLGDPMMTHQVQMKNPETIECAVMLILALESTPDVYSDETGEHWEKWLTKFESNREIKNEYQLQCLKSRISDKLMPLFEAVCKEMKDEYVSVIREFPKSLVRKTFYCRTKLPNEEWQELCNDLYSLAKRFAPENKQNDIVIQRLLSITQQNCIILPITPVTPKEALTLIYAMNDLKTIEPYSEVKNWEKWLIKFESILLPHSKELSEDAKVALLGCYLESKALELFKSLSIELRTNYGKVKQTLEIQLYQLKFQSLTRASYETWKEFADALKTMVVKAYPEMKIDESTKKVLEHFVTDKMMKPEVRSYKLKSLDEVLSLIRGLEGELNFYCDKSGKTWQKWLSTFEDNYKIQDKLQLLKDHISPDLSESFKTVCKDMKDDYVKVTTEFPKSLSKKCFDCRDKLQSEEWEHLSDDLYSLACIFVPETDQNRVVLQQLINIVKKKGICLIKTPDTLQEAFALINVTKDLLKIEKYTRLRNWEKWLASFESVLLSHKALSETAKIMLFKSYLEDVELLKLFDSFKETNYVCAQQYISIQLYKLQFESLTWVSCKNWEKFANDLTTMSIKAFPDGKGKKKALKQFLADPMMKQEVIGLNPQTIEDAVPLIMAFEYIPDAYCDRSGDSWEKWLGIFETKCTVQHEYKLKCTKIRISDELKPLFEQACKNIDFDYAKVKKEFPKLLFEQRFKCRQKLHSEKWETLLDDLCLLAKRFAPENEQRKIVLCQLVSIIQTNGISLPKKPETSEEALALIHVLNNLKGTVKYSGEGSWEDWLNVFESHFRLHEQALTDDAKVMLLKQQLEAKALRWFSTCDTKKDYKSVKRAFEVMLYTDRFESRKKDKDWKEYARDLTMLVEKAYPGLQNDKKEKKVLDHFVSDPAMQEDVKLLKPENINVAVDMCTAIEVIQPYPKQSDTCANWKQWIMYFETQADRYQLSKSSKVLCVCLIDNPREIFQNLVNIFEEDFEEAKNALERGLYENWFVSRDLLKDEFIDTLVSDLKLLAAKAYPLPNTEANCRVLKKLVVLIEKRRPILDENGNRLQLPPICLDTIGGAVLTFKVFEAMKYKQFLCGEDWDTWIAYFERTVAQSTSKSDDHTKVQCLEACISSHVKQYYELNSKDYKENFESRKIYIRQKIYIKEFDTIVKGKSQTWKQLSTHLYNTSVKAYPNLNDKEREKKVLSRFLDSVNKPKLREQNPQNTDWAVKLLEYWESESNGGVQLRNMACTKCCSKSVHGHDVVQDGNGNYVPYVESKCHAEMVDKHSTLGKVVGGIGHILTFGVALMVEKATNKEVEAWRGFTNSDKVCCNCKKGYGTHGCLPMKQQYTIEKKTSSVEHTFNN